MPKVLAPLVPPPMTTTQRNALTNPPTGSVVYNTTTNLQETNVGTPSVPVWVSSQKPVVHLSRAGDPNLLVTAAQALAWTVEEIDTHGFHAANDTKIIPTQPG